jgi:hypothetical protein
MSSFILWPLYSRDGTVVPIKQHSGWDPWPIWTFWRGENSLASTGIRILGHPHRDVVTKPNALPRLLREGSRFEINSVEG